MSNFDGGGVIIHMSYFLFIIFFEKLPRHKAPKCHSKCRLELKKVGDIDTK